MTLELCSDLSAAEWITASDLPWDQLVTFGPAGFPAYARLRLLPDPAYAGQSENDVEVDDDAPLDIAQLGAAVHVLSGHTRTPDDCYFCLWDGWGTSSSGFYLDDVPMEDLRPRPAGPGTFAPLPYRPPDPHEPPKVVVAPRAVVPHRAYFLFRGTVSAMGDWGAAEESESDLIRSDTPPAFVWPADHAWCIANDVDPHWIGIGADAAAIEELTAHPLLDVVPADPRADQPNYY